MGQTTTGELLKRCGSIYRLVILAAQRAKEVAGGAAPLVKGGGRKATSVALEEVLHGKVLYQAPEEPAASSSKKGRGAKGGKERKKAT